jgi:predicted PurR-regulated permease PerM
MSQESSFNIYKFWLSLAAFVIIVAGLKAAQSIIVPLLLSIFIATISAPAILALERLKFPRVLAFLIVLALVVSILVGIGFIFTNSADSFASSMGIYKQKLTLVMENMQDFFGQYGFDFFKKEDLQKLFDPSGIFNFATAFLKSFSTILSKSFLIFLTVMFMLFETSSLKTKIYLLLGKQSKHENPFSVFSRKLNNYLAIKTVTSLVTGILIGIGLSFLGVDFALLLGLIAFLLNYIPSIGSVIAAIPALIIALVGLDMQTVFYVLLLYVAINVIIGNVIEPRFMGKGLGLSVLVVFLSLLFWGWIFGYVGMFLAVPLSMTIKIALESHPSTKAIAMLLSSIDKKSDSR